MDADDLGPTDVVESIVNAQSIDKTIRPKSSKRRRTSERLYVIKSFNYSGTLVYTKGTIAKEEGEDVFYVLISTKVATTS